MKNDSNTTWHLQGVVIAFGSYQQAADYRNARQDMMHATPFPKAYNWTN